MVTVVQLHPQSGAAALGTLAEGLGQLVHAVEILGSREQNPGGAAGCIKPHACQARGQPEGMVPYRLPGRELLPRIERLGELQGATYQCAIVLRQALRKRAEGGRAAVRMQLDYGDHAVFYGFR